MASYPSFVRAFVRRIDKIDVNTAEDINDLQEEVVALQTSVGRNPATGVSYPTATTLVERLTFFELDVLPRLAALEDRFRRAAVSARRAAALQVNSSDAWQPVVLPDVSLTLNDFTPSVLYDAPLGRFFSVAPSPGYWTLSASVTFQESTSPVGVRGLAILTAAGTVLAQNEVGALPNEPTTISVSWTGRLPIDPAFYLSLAVKQNQGTALFLQGDTATTPFRADFTHTPS